MKPSSPLLPLSLLLFSSLCLPVSALQLKLEGRHRLRRGSMGDDPHGTTRRRFANDDPHSAFQNRDDVGGSGLARRDPVQGSTSLSNTGDISYYANITMGGQQFSVLIDTGSADLWVAGTVPGATDSGQTASVTYAIGEVEGPIKFGALDFAGFTVSNQAYLEITPSQQNPEGQGLIGLGPVSGSNVFNTINSVSGMSVLDRIFLQDKSTPNFLTVNLGRQDDPNDIFNGDISIGETINSTTGGDSSQESPNVNFTAILDNPKLAVTIVSVGDAGNQHFQTLLDQNGLIGPDNQSIPLTTVVSATSNKNQATVVLDTGFSLTQLPEDASNAIYSRVTGAELVNVTGIGRTWIVPCNMEINISFAFAGHNYPIHPLDTTLDPTIIGLDPLKNSEGQVSCIGTFQPFSFDPGNGPTFDIILGMSFIRNVYALFDYGDFIGDGEEKGDPYLQFLSTTNMAQAHADFVKIRLNGDDTTGQQVLGAPDTASSSTTHRTVSKNILIYLILGAVALFLALAVGIGYCCVRRRQSPSGGKWGYAAGGAYKPLGDANPYGNYGGGPVGGNVPMNTFAPNRPAAASTYQYANANSGTGYGMGGQGFAPSQPLYDPPSVPPPPRQGAGYVPPPGPPPGYGGPAPYDNPFEPPRR